MRRPLTPIARNIKKFRDKLGVSQDKLSKLAGVTVHTLSKIEIGATPDPRIETLKKIAKALGVGVEDLIK
jgi:transcriptional regulator with XRE-family HTH domain